MARFSRRTVLRGAGATLALPLLNCFLDGNGTALAGGAPLPVRFGTWHWGCGVNAARWVPQKDGKDYAFPAEMKPLEPFRGQIVPLTGFNVPLDGKPNYVHHTGNTAIRVGAAPAEKATSGGESIDVTVANAIGAGTRFRAISAAATGDAQHSYSYLSATVRNPADTSPVALYARLFGPEFQDPNAGEFKPDPRVQLRQSILSQIKDDRVTFVRDLGGEDRARIDQFFTSLRELEQRLALQLEKPAPAEACVPMKGMNERPPATDIETVSFNHDAMMQLIAMALACNQTRVFNMVFSDAASTLRKTGSGVNHHLMTHEEPMDPQLGYQPTATFFVERSIAALAGALKLLAGMPEGDGTLLDNVLLLAHSDCNAARIHQVEGIPIILAGKAGGRLRPGIHVAGAGAPVSRIGLTAMQAMGVPVDSWGDGSMKTGNPLGELLA